MLNLESLHNTPLSLNPSSVRGSISPPLMSSTMVSEGISHLSLSNEHELPQIVHTWDSDGAIISSIVAPKHQYLICGTQNGKILIFSLKDYLLVHTIAEPEMTGSNLCIDVTEDEKYLFAAGSDSLVKVYDLESLPIQCIKIIYSSVDIGDIFSIYYCPNLKVLFVGCQNASIAWCKVDFSEFNNLLSIDRNNLPHLRYNKFFDSTGPGGRINTQRKHVDFLNEISLCEIKPSDLQHFAHFGYVYSLWIFSDELVRLKFPQHEKFLVSGGGDGIINFWGIANHEQGLLLVRLKSLENEESILSTHINHTYLYVGLSSGKINVWDLLTFQLIKSFHTPQSEPVNCLRVVNNMIYYGNKLGLNVISNRRIYKINSDPILTLHLHKKDTTNEIQLVTGGTKFIKYYNCSGVSESDNIRVPKGELDDELLLKNLKRFVAYKTISKYHDLYMDEFRACTKFLVKLLDTHGAKSTHLLPIENGNPIVISTFKNNKGLENAPRLLYYGHYDVVEAEDTDNWTVDPFKVTSKNGFLYGRGTTDNKGPTLAIIHAVSELFRAGQLAVDFTFVIEGEEENGSLKFQETILQNLNLIGHIDWILLSNSYWLDDVRPCLNYGLRGVLHCSIRIESEKPDRHSGVDGGVLREPTMDLIQVLHTLTDPISNKILIPHFYENIKPLSDFEKNLFNKIQKYNPKFKKEELVAKWTQPSLTVHKVDVSGPNNDTVIPKTAKASFSIRVVPNQDVTDIKKNLVQYLEDSFGKLNSENKIYVDIEREVEPWFGDVDNSFYKILFSNLKKNWGVEPLMIREGGSIPSIRFLEKTLNAPASQIPGGQSSDNAHLRDEKVRLINLFKLKDTVKDSIRDLSAAN